MCITCVLVRWPIPIRAPIICNGGYVTRQVEKGKGKILPRSAASVKLDEDNDLVSLILQIMLYRGLIESLRTMLQTIQTVKAGGDNEATGIDCNAISSNLHSKISCDSPLQYISTT
jgi:hypothetical protein